MGGRHETATALLTMPGSHAPLVRVPPVPGVLQCDADHPDRARVAGDMPVTPVQIALQPHLDDAEARAWDSLARYKFQMFGYWGAIWVHLNRIGEFGRSNPWRSIVAVARDHARVPENDIESLAAEQGVFPTLAAREFAGGWPEGADFDSFLAAVNETQENQPETRGQ